MGIPHVNRPAVIDKRHGGPYDRGGADSYYSRPRNPHYYEGRTGTSRRIEQSEMTDEQIKQYNQGYDDNEADDHKKDWG